LGGVLKYINYSVYLSEMNGINPVLNIQVQFFFES
jgi:hypothetical protein